MRDARVLAELGRHELVPAIWLPDPAVRDARERARFRRWLIGANIKLGAVAADILGVSSRAMLTALVAGDDDPVALAGLARGALKLKHARLVAARKGVVGPHQRRMLATQLRHVDFLDAEVAGLSDEIEARMRPFAAAIALADTIPGLGQRTAEAVMAEIGTDMGRFPSAAHLASWARVCPGTDESAGKRGSGKTGPGNKWLRTPARLSG